MQNIDFLTLKAFFNENIDFLIGARLQKIQQPTRKDIILFLRNNSLSRKLYINIDPAIYHISFLSADGEERRGIKIPKQPPMFCMLLRKYLEGCRISDVCVVDNERIMELHFETCDEFGQMRSLCLCFELMGKHSNIILYDRNSSIIIGCIHNVGAEKSRYRELQGGLKYIYPPMAKDFLSNELKIQFKNLSKDEIQKYLTSENYNPAILNDRYTLFSELIAGAEPQISVSDMIEKYYSKFQAEKFLDNEKSKLLNIVGSKLKKVNSSCEKVQSLLKKRDNTEKYKLYGDLLTANLYRKEDYKKQIKVLNYVNGENITIELDENKTLSENAQRYYKLYTKSKTTKDKSTEILTKLQIEKEYLDNIVYSVNSASNIEELSELESELGISRENKQNKPVKAPTIMKIVIEGFDVYIGKNNKQNDFIVSKIAKDDDYWFHTRLCAGSHVLLKINYTEPDERVLLECCKLAKKYSSASQSSKVRVIYTKRKFVKKPPAAPSGYVIYKNEKEILV